MFYVDQPSRWALIRHAVGDAASWILAVLLAGALRTEDQPGGPPLALLAFSAAVAALLQLAVGLLTGLYRRRARYGSFWELQRLILTVLIVGVLLTALMAWGDVDGVLPFSVSILATPLALSAAFALRYLFRARLSTRLASSHDGRPALLYGAGYLGAMMIHRLRADSSTEFRPVGLIDDDPDKRGMDVEGVPVLGDRTDLPAAAEATGAEAVIVTVADADSAFISAVTDQARDLGLETFVLPPLDETIRGEHQGTNLHTVDIMDLIGRRPVELDETSIAATLKGKRVLVTGAGGSIGSELCRQLTRFDPAELIMLDRDETGLQSTEVSIHGHGLLNTGDVVLADIRDAASLRRIFSERRPEVVFHAAALKHLPMLEAFPDEAWKSNVLGTLNVLRAALEQDVEAFVNISTDKAADPTSALGQSKRLAERLTAWAARSGTGRYMSVRFGNVLGSRGSMVPLFQRMIEQGGPLTVTDPEATRFFMTIPEASQLVIQAAGIGRPGEVMILDMGDPVRILDVARRLIELSGKDVDIVFTGLRPGEKLHEDLTAAGERGESPFHPKIFHATVTPLAPEELDRDHWDAFVSRDSRDVRSGPRSPFRGEPAEAAADVADVADFPETSGHEPLPQAEPEPESVAFTPFGHSDDDAHRTGAPRRPGRYQPRHRAESR